MTENEEPLSDSQPVYGRTFWDAGAGATQSKLVALVVITFLFSIVVWLFWDQLSSMPLYVLTSLFASLLWYGPICRWVSRSGTYIEVWEPQSNTLTTWRVGKRAMSSFEHVGESNVIRSVFGSSRLFANKLDPEEGVLETTWVHDCDPWNYHVERRTLNKLTAKVNEVYDDIIIGESMAQVEGRGHAMVSMRKHYADLDRFFVGDVNVQEDEVNVDAPVEV